MNAPLARGRSLVRGSPAAAATPEGPGVAGVGCCADERRSRDQGGRAGRAFVVERRYRARLARPPGADVPGRRTARLDAAGRLAPHPA